MQKKEKKTGGEKKRTAPGWIVELLKGSCLGGGVAVLVLMACAGLISGGMVKEQYADGCVLAACVAGAFCGGLYAVRRLKTRPLPVGLAVGTILLILLFSAGFLACGEISLRGRGGEAAAACLIGGMISGIFCCNSRKKPKKY